MEIVFIGIILILSLLCGELYRENKNLKLSKKDCIQESIPVIGTKQITVKDLYDYKDWDIPAIGEFKPPRGNSGITTSINFNK